MQIASDNSKQNNRTLSIDVGFRNMGWVLVVNDKIEQYDTWDLVPQMKMCAAESVLGIRSMTAKIVMLYRHLTFDTVIIERQQAKSGTLRLIQGLLVALAPADCRIQLIQPTRKSSLWANQKTTYSQRKQLAMNFARESTGLLQLDSHQSDAYCQYITSRRNKSPPESRKQSLSEIFGESD